MTVGFFKVSIFFFVNSCFIRALIAFDTRNSSADEITKVNIYDDVVHVRQNTIDSRINSTTGRRSSSQDICLAQC